jgi:fibronectin type III domain protein
MSYRTARRLSVCFLLFLLGTPRTIHAQSPAPGLLAYEPFSNTNVPLNGSSSGSGWAAAWVTQNNDQTVPGYGLSANNPLLIAGLEQSGSYATGGSVDQTAGRALDTSSSGAFAAYLSSGSIGASGTTIWMSVVLRKDSTANDELSVTLLPGGTPWWAGYGHLSAGYFGGASNNGGIQYWSLRVNGAVYPTTVPMVVGQPALLVLRIDFGGSTTTSLFVNPEPGASDPGDADAQTTVTTSLAFNNVAFYGGDSAGDGSIDEIRLASSYAAATPAVATATPPQHLTAAPGDGSVVLNWTASSGATSYNLYESLTNGYSLVASNISSSTFSQTGLTDDTSYSFYVTAVSAAGGESGASNIVRAMPAAGLTTSGAAGLLAHEPFNESAGPLFGANSGAGWAAAWDVQNSSVTVPGLNIAAGTPLTYPGLPQSGNYAVGGCTFFTAGRGFDLTAQGPFSSYLSGGLIGMPGKTLWMSVLMRKDAASQDEFSVALHSGNPAWVISQNPIKIGYFGWDSYVNSTSTGYWSLELDNVVYQSTTPVVQGQAALLVVRIDFGATTTVNFYVNPPVGSTPPAAPDLQATTTNSVAFRSVGYSSGYDANQTSVDEIRVAGDYGTLVTATAVVPTPPSSVTATTGNGQVALSWTAAGEASGYQVWASSDGVNYKMIATVSGTSYTQTGLTNGSTYHYYVTTVTGAGVSLSSDEVATVPRVPVPAPKARLGSNLTAISDWTRQWPFVDIFKLARAWIPQQEGATWGQGPALQLTADGWPASLQPGQYAETIIFDNALDDAAADYPTGNYNLFYDGEGTISFDLGTATIVSQTPGQMVVNVPGSALGIFLKITQTNPANPLRNIRFIMPGFENTYQTQPFHPLFLSTMQNYKVLRFMEWMFANNSTVQNWSDRAVPTDYTKTQKGVDLETMIQLANTMHVSPWFNIPHGATDDFVQQFATMVNQQLDPTLPAYIEYSNETWNGMFSQNSYVQSQGLSLGLSQDPTQAGAYYTSLRSVQIFQIFQQVFGGTDRLVRVLPSQAANASMSQQIVSFRNASAYADVLAIAPYYSMCSDQAIGGWGFLGDEATQDQVAAMTPDQVLDIELTHIQNCALDQMTSNRAVAQQYGLNLVAYEGGQSLQGVGSAQNNTDLTNLFKTVNRNSRMQTLYEAFLQNWITIGGDLFVHYADVGSYTKYGFFGTLEYQDQNLTTSPKYQALAAFAAQTQ